MVESNPRSHGKTRAGTGSLPRIRGGVPPAGVRRMELPDDSADSEGMPRVVGSAVTDPALRRCAEYPTLMAPSHSVCRSADKSLSGAVRSPPHDMDMTDPSYAQPCRAVVDIRFGAS